MGNERPLPGGFTRSVAGDPYKQTEQEPGEGSLGICVIACRDLLSYSRFAAAAKAAGYRPLQAEGPEAVRAVAAEAAFVIVDLQDPAGGLAAVRAAKQAAEAGVVYAVGPHVETELLQAARDAGASQVLTHSAASRSLGELLMPPGDLTHRKRPDEPHETP